MKYEDKNKIIKSVNRDILLVFDLIEQRDIDFKKDLEQNKDILIDKDDSNLGDTFFKDFFSYIEGYAKLIDNYYLNINSSYYNIV